MDQALLPGGWPRVAHDAQAQAADLVEQARRTLAVAQGLFAVGRRVDLTGLDRAIGLLCAKALDLQPDQGRALRSELISLVSDLDLLSLAMRENRA